MLSTKEQMDQLLASRSSVLQLQELIGRDCEDMIFHEPTEEDESFEDDGCLHVRIGGVRFCHFVGQEVSERKLQHLLSEFAAHLRAQLLQ